MSSQTLTGISAQRQSRLTIAAVAAAITGVAVTLIVAAVIAFGLTPARVDSPRVLGPMDDYWFRHAPAAKALGPVDDYGTRHAPAPRTLGPVDDFGNRHRP
jgi:hypothetical protein